MLLRPETIWLLLNLSVHKQGSEEFSVPINTLVVRTGLHNTRITRGFNELVEKGILKRRYSKPEKGKSRSRYRFLMEKGLFPIIQEFPAITEFIFKFIREHKKFDDVEGFKALDKLVLLVLLCYSDHKGVVCDVGLGDIARNCGMKKDRVERYVSRLIDQEYIVKYVPGFTDARIFGVVKGNYVLNLHKLQFLESHSSNGFIMRYESETMDSNAELNAIHAVLRVLRRSRDIRSKHVNLKNTLGDILYFIERYNIDDDFLSFLISVDVELPIKWSEQVIDYLNFHLDYAVGDVLAGFKDDDVLNNVEKERFDEVNQRLKDRLAKSKHVTGESKESEFRDFLCHLLTYAVLFRVKWLHPQLTPVGRGAQRDLTYVQVEESPVEGDDRNPTGMVIVKYLLLGYAKVSLPEQGLSTARVKEVYAYKKDSAEGSYYEYDVKDGPTLRYNTDFKLIV